MPLDKSSFVNIDPDVPNDMNTSIYRIFSLEKFIDVLTNNHLTLVKPKLWDDPFENFILNNTEYNHEIEKHLDLKNEQEKILGQCWTLNKETDFMWRVYAPYKDGIMVKTTVQKIYDQIITPFNNAPNFFLFGKVHYLGESDIREYFESVPLSQVFSNTTCNNWLSRTLFFKRLEFRPEAEFRIIFWSETAYGKDSNIMQFSFSPNELFDEITIDPRIDQIKFESYVKTINKLGYTNPIKKSELYNIPNLKLKY